jgi:hypothetical protein
MVPHKSDKRQFTRLVFCCEMKELNPNENTLLAELMRMMGILK